MSDITRDDLRVKASAWMREITDEEFDRLARDAGYIPLAEGAVLEYYRTYASDSERARMLRALLTDKCPDEECVDGHLWVENHQGDALQSEIRGGVVEHRACGGRGWLPKDGVVVIGIGSWRCNTCGQDCRADGPGCDGVDYDNTALLGVPIGWLEAEDE